MKTVSYIDADGEVAELDDASFENAKVGRQPLPNHMKKRRVNMSLDPDLVDALKATGKGWQTRVNAVLRKELNL